MTIYEEHGWASRQEYFESLAEEYGIPFYEVRAIGELLGPEEDFDGLISSLEDWVE